MVFLYIIGLLSVCAILVAQTIIAVEDDKVNKSWLYQFWGFIRYGFRKDLKKMYLGKDKERYNRELMAILAHVTDNAQRGLSSCYITLEKDLNDEDIKIIVGMAKRAIESRFNNKFSVVAMYGYKRYDIKVEWS
jgi:hypothetical protein|nr:MAG TPA: hypothetical protein [Caudoviricetes sp.]